ncbi:hypothetical protein ATL31_1322 [Phycicoccus duodecadis]|uniref:TadE-like protein n=2 Tax=Phycicoccus duodecadis TaxID=173053 RepID=A0A2N3YI46_9MICO|nr:hypothetical protein ATL31_1322 [Phycicoccus duodecadis]
MVTAELAVAVPALLVVLALALSAVRLGIDGVRAVDAAHLAARAVARGETPSAARAEAVDHAPPGSRVVVDVGGAWVGVTVTPPVPPLLAALGVGAASGDARARLEASSPQGGTTAGAGR